MHRSGRVVSSFAGLCALALLLLACSDPGAQPSDESLFNGRDLTGWRGDGKHWFVEGGELIGRTTADEPLRENTFLVHAGEYADFDLRFEYRIESGNSGMQYRSHGADDASLAGYQADLEAGPNYSGILYESNGRGIMVERGERARFHAHAFGRQRVADAGALQAVIDADGWNHYQVIAQGPRLVHRINGHTMMEAIDEDVGRRADRGYFALQLHVGPPMTVRYRNIRVRRLPPIAWAPRDIEAVASNAPVAPAAPAATRLAGPRPEWIWVDARGDDDAFAVFRRNFEVKGKPQTGEMLIAADDRFELWLNGERVAADHDWTVVRRYDVATKLRSGANLLAVRVQNDSASPAGLLLRLTWRGDDGVDQVMVSDALFAAAKGRVDGFEAVDFDATAFAGAHSFGPYDGHQGPWSDVLGDLLKPRVATPASAIQVPKGFTIELLHSAQIGEGSWSAMTVDDAGRVILSPEKGPLLRLTVQDAPRTPVTVEHLAVPGDAQGLLYAYDSLYVNRNAGHDVGGLYRCRDADRDGRFETTERLATYGGGGEHGCHAIVLGPDGALYTVNGNYTELPPLAPRSPHRDYAEDLLAKREWDPRGHARDIVAPGARVLRTDADGSTFELFAAGMRNPYDLAFNDDGELFTYDADMEWDIGLPWYRPTRVVHLVSAGEYGWRSGSGKWPTYYADSLPAAVDIGIGSPTGIVYGGGSLRTRDGKVVRGNSGFPEPYRSALLIMDWAYGKIHAVFLDPAGSSYTGRFEEFCSGRPFAVTDLEFGPDGALYLTTGGRGGQSGLYRIRYTGPIEVAASAAPAAGERAARPAGVMADQRAARQAIEAYHVQIGLDAVDTLWPKLADADRFTRYAARVALERQRAPQAQRVAGVADAADIPWRDRALAEDDVDRRLAALLALSRIDGSASAAIVGALGRTPWSQLDLRQRLEELRLYQVLFCRAGRPTPALAAALRERLDAQYPSGQVDVDRELLIVLAACGATTLPERTLPLVEAAATPAEQIQYAFLLRDVEQGFTPERRERLFRWLGKAMTYEGGMSFQGFLRYIEDAVLERAPNDEREGLAKILQAAREAAAVKPAPVVMAAATPTPRWQWNDLLPALEGAGHGRSAARGREAYSKALCSNCHRLGGAGGFVGPDLTGAGARFGRRDLLETMLTPSKDISSQYQDEEFRLKDGSVLVGRVVLEDRTSVHLECNPLGPTRATLYKGNIAARAPSRVSPMPERLLDALELDEILDLLAWVESGGDPLAAPFRH